MQKHGLRAMHDVMTAPDETIHDVVIVGGGPVGMGLAIELGRRGVEVAVVERFAQPQPIPKGQNLTQRTMEHMQAWGTEAALRAARIVPEGYAIGGLTAYGTLLGDYHYDWLQREIVRPFYATANERLPQYRTEAVLRRRVGDLSNVRILYGWQAVDVAQDAESATATIREEDGGREQVLRGRTLVGCDGSRSVVRAKAGITETLRDHDRLMVLLVFRSEQLHRLLERYPGKQFYCVLHPDLKGYWLFFGRVDLGTTWFFHAPVPAGTTRDNYDFEALLHRAAGQAFDVTIDHVGFWDLRVAVADTYRAGRIFIAGDAAHSHPPYGGYGINTGFEDARNLGWKLAAVQEGWGGSDLLDSYDAERRPVFVSTARDFIERAIEADRAFLAAFDPTQDRAAFEAAWSARSRGTTDEVNSFEPNYAGSPTVFGPDGASCSAIGRHAFEARAGHHLAPQPLSDGRSVFEALGDGFTLLAFDVPDHVVDAFRTAAASLTVPLAVVRDGRDGGREKYDAAMILVRPDHFVAWVGDGSDCDAAEILRRVTGN
jgi:2-polyprenyl-6-methoxyphenol hydroxylase-like FAD-dependent oxidoreductase